MAEYIDRVVLIETLKNCRDAHADVDDAEGCGLIEDVMQEIIELASADVAPVVRCKDCKQLQCCNFTQFLGVDGYCSYGEYEHNTEGIKWQTKR